MKRGHAEEYPQGLETGSGGLFVCTLHTLDPGAFVGWGGPVKVDEGLSST